MTSRVWILRVQREDSPVPTVVEIRGDSSQAVQEFSVLQFVDRFRCRRLIPENTIRNLSAVCRFALGQGASAINCCYPTLISF